MWDERYSGNDYAYGKQPNDFLVSVVDRFPDGNALCLGGGEGRNAVWMAAQGLDVTIVDASSVGLEKALRLAEDRGVTIRAIHTDLADFPLEPSTWSLIVSIFCHLPPPLRRAVHAHVVEGLTPGGRFLLEAFTPAQLAYGTGGPKNPEMLMDLETLREELTGLDLHRAQELIRTIHEGPFHSGPGAVVQIVAVRGSCEPKIPDD